MLSNVDIYELPIDRFIHVLAELHIRDSMHDKEVTEHIQRSRGEIMAKLEGYNSNESYGMTNDSSETGEPLPYIRSPAYIEPTEDGYPGLDPPVG